MYKRLEMAAPKLIHKNGRVLSISHSSNLSDLVSLQPEEIISADYPEHNILALAFPDASFNYVISDQVLEHVEGNPQQAIDECYRVLRPNGIAIHTTCCINPIHAAPLDFWRFTPYALSLLHRNWAEVIDVGGWGNFEALALIQDGLRYARVPLAEWHPFHKMAVKNDPEWPITIWIIAKK